MLQGLAKPRLLLAYPGDAQVCAALARPVGELPAQLDGRMAMLVGSIKITKEGMGVAEAPPRLAPGGSPGVRVARPLSLEACTFQRISRQVT